MIEDNERTQGIVNAVTDPNFVAWLEEQQGFAAGRAKLYAAEDKTPLRNLNLRQATMLRNVLAALARDPA